MDSGNGSDLAIWDTHGTAQFLTFTHDIAIDWCRAFIKCEYV